METMTWAHGGSGVRVLYHSSSATPLTLLVRNNGPDKVDILTEAEAMIQDLVAGSEVLLTRVGVKIKMSAGSGNAVGQIWVRETGGP